MSDSTLDIEIFSAPSCNQCNKAFQLTEMVLKERGDISANLRVVNVVDELDYAVKLGVRATPGIAINGVLVFTALPSKATLHEAITLRITKGETALPDKTRP
ncbi:MAG: glutaredoxin [Gammaproteobacteria bacterium]|nr:glutaredoxin [Gammaproteobacteria bacterium]